MDRTFAEVRAAYRAWARAQDEVATPAPVQAAFDALRDAAGRATARVVGDARAWSNGLLDDAEFERAVMALAVALACDAWCQGSMGARARQDREGGE